MEIEVFDFHYRRIPVISGYNLKRLSSLSQGTYYLSLDLGLTFSPIKIVSEGIILEEYNIFLKIDNIRKLKIKESSIYAIFQDGLKEVAFFANGKYYRLKVVIENRAPTLEISGIHMHRIKDIDPLGDTYLKIRAAQISKKHIVLDICTGLGYTAIASLKYGARKVYTIEIDENVLAIAQFNPWSKLLENDKIHVLLGDAFNMVKVLKDEAFNRIIHDPPRFSLAGELYSEEFYSELYRILKPGGALFHYVGFPGKFSRRIDMIKGVKTRLERVGFITYPKPKAFGVIAIKPRD